MKTGGLGAEKMSDPEVEEAVKNVKGILEEKTNTKYDSIEILSYKPQLVAGMNYFVKVSDVYFYLISLFKVYFCSDYYSNKILLFYSHLGQGYIFGWYRENHASQNLQGS